MSWKLLLLVLSMVQADKNDDQCQPWSFYNDTLQECQCYEIPALTSHYVTTHRDFIIQCSERKVEMNVAFCMTHERDGTFIGDCHTYLNKPNAILVDGMYVSLPDNISELNDFMCGKINRKGRICRECIDGFAPSMTSLGYECSNCTINGNYGVLFYLFLEFVPITSFYLVVLLFKVSLTSPPMTYCVMYSQTALFYLSLSPMAIILRSNHERVFAKILMTFHGIWSLDFFRYVVPPFCVSPKLKFIHVFFLRYISAIYPLLMIALTWLFIQICSHNFKPLVLLCSKLSCLKLKTEIADIFATFFLLSYTKLCFTSMMVLANTTIYNANSAQSHKYVRIDPNIPFFGKEHIPYVVVLLQSCLYLDCYQLCC